MEVPKTLRLALKFACCRHMQNVTSSLPGWQRRQEEAGASSCLAEAVSQKNPAELHPLPSLAWSSGHAIVTFSWSNALIEGEARVPSVSSFWNLSSSTCQHMPVCRDLQQR